MNYNKIFFFDLDGTLCPNNDLKVSVEMIELLKTFPERGILPVIASGRSFYETKPLLEMLAIDSYILSNGCYVVCQGTVVKESFISNVIIQKVLSLARKNNHDVGFFHQNGYAFTGISTATSEHLSSMNLSKNIIDPNYYRKHKINFLNIYLPKKEETIYQNIFAKQANFFRYAPMAIDVLPSDVSKSQGITILLSAMNGKNISTYAFGDQNNDLSMFSKVDYGIAMKQATRELKQKASYVAQTDFGVVEGLKYYHLV
ncbi:Cof-type HAD-IIB family hydrolase [Leuconostoc falkenbergense]|uniref:Cof-type HAD-IIB family hydrolase n=1 Tax=Leuconostoc falkenbergense TaxID=2766470 RepID=A0ABT7S0M8_9LACO|nr:Cof-type HAD-IIB family hydrolase [Leuconostoc falkenbergense]MDM7647115.1 Cof-type HAD-IIB family hydrolase [Leuconostoc falkenbergense]